jgi:hypothetical protein
MEFTTATTPRKTRPKPPTGGLAVMRQLTRSANERVIMEYAVSLTVNIIVNAKNEKQAIDQAKDIIESISNVYAVAVNSTQLNDYMVEA